MNSANAERWRCILKKYTIMVIALVILGILMSCDPLSLLVLTGTVEGVVVDVTSGDGIGDVLVTIQGEDGSSTTGSDGRFTITVPVGIQTLIFNKTGYFFPNQVVNVNEDQTTMIPESEIVGNPDLGSGEYRIVLTWGANPADLDSHLLTPGGEHIYYMNETGTDAFLDVDDVTSYGPETVTITTEEVGTYKYYVHRYSGSGTLAGSGALVRVFDDNGLKRSFTAPSSGSGDYWFVFTMNGGAITTVDQIQGTEPTF
jgi:hypothetical protein